MKNLQEATERICELKGSLVALDALTASMLHMLSPEQRAELRPTLERHAEVARSVLLHAPVSEHTIATFEREVGAQLALLARADAGAPAVEPVLLSTVRVDTFDGQRALTSATGFFFARDERLYLVTSRHVVIDEPTGHNPDRIEIGLHIDADNLTRSTGFSLLLYRDGRANWREAADAGGPIDVAVLELDRASLPEGTVLQAFTPAHVKPPPSDASVGRPVSIVGFPMGFHDTLHHLPVVRQAAIASSYGLRFQGRGFFLTDGRTHRGTSGAPVLLRGATQSRTSLDGALLGVHSSRIDIGSRDRSEDEQLGLNCAWYADVLLVLTEA